MKKNFLKSRKKGFTLVELLIGMTIFTIGITSIFLLLESTFKSASISRNEVVVANLLREQSELIRNLKENNYKNFSKWNSAKIEDENGIILENGILEDGDFLIENNFSENNFEFDENGKMSKSPVKIEKINLENLELQEIFEKTRLCFDEEKFYIHCKNDSDRTASGTAFASYTKIEKMKYDGENTIQKDDENQAYVIDSRVITKDGATYREYDSKTIITNWMK